MAYRRHYPIPTRYHPPTPLPTRHRRLTDQKGGLVGIGLLALTLLVITVGAQVVPWLPNRVALDEALQAPSLRHPLGTDNFGRDVLSRLLWGGRVSLSAGLLSVVLATSVGSLLGIVAGYVGGLVDAAIGALAEVILAFPSLLLALVMAWLFGRDMAKAAIAVGIASTPIYIRIARNSVRRTRRAPFVRAAEAVGATDGRILFCHILPNIAGPLLSLAMINLGWAILYVSGLSFLGMGAHPPQAEWGAMLSDARAYMREAPWLGLAPGAAIAVTVLAVNLLGEAWQESLYPSKSAGVYT